MKIKLTKSIKKTTREKANPNLPIQSKRTKKSVVKKLRGVLKEKLPANTDWRDVKLSYLKDKHAL